MTSYVNSGSGASCQFDKRSRGPKDDNRGCVTLRGECGFSLLEVAVVIVLLALLLGSVALPIATKHQIAKRSEVQHDLRRIKQALIGFAVERGRLP